MLHQIFFTAIAAVLFFILITKIAFAVINGDKYDNQRTTAHDLSKVIGEELNPKTEKSSSSKRKGKKKVRFAVDHDAFMVNKVVAGPSETKQVVFEKDHDEELISLNDVGSPVKSPEEGFVGGIETENADYDGVIDYDQTKQGKIELIYEENVANHDDEGLIRLKLMCDDGIDEDQKEKEGLISDEDDSDDWEGVERSDLEKVFAMAADYGKMDDNLGNLASDIQMQLYGLHKVATEGPCYEPQPMALKVFARAKWNAWQKLGNMNPDVAMEQYVTLLSEKVPEWSHSRSVGTDVSSSITTSILDTCHIERKREIESCSDAGDPIGVSDSMNEDKQ
ncbi:acyl-CoA-binding domain-containing protein 3-like isoform X2 [Cynara cardunculus var. scolymus]|uniref:acyl-CoA-binding domain-containing protein 3-like isoform X2 n=1 Tax=Cynara cardunculus var. scolymus TaxID=59895 RepID=UPI000D62E61B|nr:acyl-CoA-binding domain-containing protein 3-like isoform X2 [Cynara cardunculus var. scolymus]XP_024993013.1 acyl-CoA-binding domain-containing protein 3-like isoform X2 [Cynara cardunculus var. scolymus]